jgi:rare lipoprotein A (peptidoglycan hydrolase)
MPRLIVLPLCLVLFGVVLLAACSGGGAGGRKAPAASPAPLDTLASSTSSPAGSTTSTSLVVPPTTPTTRSRPPTADGSAAAGDVGEQTALASWYGDESGSRTASGEPFNPDAYTFANRSMPFGTVVSFCHGSRCVQATCTDRGPFAGGRSFDLSRATFAAIAPLGAGVISVSWRIV